MSNTNVKYGDKMACLSSIVESLITPFMSLKDYEEWRKEEYGNAYYAPIRDRNTISIEDAVHTMRMNHGRDEVLKTLVDCGLSETEALALIDENDDKYYRPKLIDGNYICPNCGHIVSKDQEQCDNDNCHIKFVWSKMTEYIFSITYNFDMDYIAKKCDTYAEALRMLNEYLSEEINTIKTESEYNPSVLRWTQDDVVLVYAENYTTKDNREYALEDCAYYRIFALKS